jgi:hypothetical protein
MSENVTNEENKKTVGFKVSAHEYNVLKQYTQILHNQMIQDPETGQQRRMLEAGDRVFNPQCDLWLSSSISVYDATASQD